MQRSHLLATLLLLLAATPTAHAADWPQLLGPSRDGAIPPPLIEPWPDAGPKKLWSLEVGEGFAGPVVAGNRVLLFHRRGGAEVLEALDVRTGKTVWRGASPTRYRDDFGFNGGPRAAPVVAGDQVFTHGAEGVLTAWRLGTGEQLWQRRTLQELGHNAKGFFGAAASPLVTDKLVLLNVGGKGAGVVAFDRATGKTVWHTGDDEASYSSPTFGTFAGHRAALFFTREGLLALAPDEGTVLGRFAHKTRIRSSVNAATPLMLGDDRVFLSAAYGAGAVLLDVSGAQPKPIWASDEAMTNHYATAIAYDGFLYGYHGRQEGSPALRCVEVATGNVRWSQDRFGAGSILRSGDRLLVLREDGQLLLVAADPSRFRVLSQARILDGEARAYPAVADGRLFARDDRRLVAVELPTRPVP